MTMLFITHDFGVVDDIADDVAVMYQGEIVEQGTHKELLQKKGVYHRLIQLQSFS